MFPDYIGIQDQGRRSRHVGINHPALIQRDRHPYIEYFEDSSASGGLKFEPVDKSRSSGTQRLGEIAIYGWTPISDISPQLSRQQN